MGKIDAGLLDSWLGWGTGEAEDVGPGHRLVGSDPAWLLGSCVTLCSSSTA